jgi:hypothetical protein
MRSGCMGSADMSRYYFDLRDGEQFFIVKRAPKCPTWRPSKKRSPNHWQRWLGTRCVCATAGLARANFWLSFVRRANGTDE